jgi:hypothetical protein
MESISKIAILRLFARPPVPFIFTIIKPTIFKLQIFIEEYIRINDTFGFFDSISISSEIEHGLGPFQI